MLQKITDTIQGKAPLAVKRSSQWSVIRRKHLTNHPCCAVCGGTSKLEVHHIKPFHTHPELELDPDNLITLCESKSFGVICHLFVGHLGSYKAINPNVVEDAKNWNTKIKLRYERKKT